MITFSCFGLAMAALGSWFYVSTRTPPPDPVLAERSLDGTGDVAAYLSRPEAGVPKSAEIPGADDTAVDRSESPNAARADDPTAIAKPDRHPPPSKQPTVSDGGTSRNVQAGLQAEEETEESGPTATLEEASPNAPATDGQESGGVPAIKAIKSLNEPKLSRYFRSTAIIDLAVSSTGQYVVAIHVGPTCIRVWDLETDHPQTEIKDESTIGSLQRPWISVGNRPGQGRVAVVDNQVLVPGVFMGTMEFGLLTGKPAHLRGRWAGRLWMATSANGKWVASREGHLRTLKIRDVPTDVVILKMSGKPQVASLTPTGDLFAGAYSAAKWVAASYSGPESHDVTVWELPSGRAIGTCTDVESTATFLLFPPGEDWVAIGRGHRLTRGPKQHLPILRYDFLSGEKIGVIGNADIEQIVDAVFLPGGKLMALADGRGTIHIWNIEKEAVGAVLIGHKGAVNSLVVLPNGKTLLSGGKDGSIKFWDVAQIVRSVWPASFSQDSFAALEQPAQTSVATDLHESVAKNEVSVSPIIPGSVAAHEQPAQTPVAVDLYEAVTKNEVSVSLTIPGTHVDLFGPQDHPFDAQLTLKKESRSRNPIRIVLKPGTVIEGDRNSVVIIDEVTLVLPPDLDEKTIPLKAYLQRIPTARYGMGGDYRSPREGWKYVYSIPDLHAASDPVRQAVVWIIKGATYVKYAEVYSTRYTGKSEGEVTRTDPFQITKDQWAEAQRIVKIVTPQRQRELDLVEAKKRLYKERQRLGAKVLAEAKAKAKAQIELAERLEADREARTKTVTLQQALADGLVKVSVDALVPPPAMIELRIQPTPKLGTTILDLWVSPGTVLREASGGPSVKTGYLGQGRTEVELGKSAGLQLTCFLRSLDDAGPGDFVVDRPNPFVAFMMRRAGHVRILAVHGLGRLSQFGSEEYAQQAVYLQIIVLVHGDKGRTIQQWKEAFKSKGMDDPYSSIKTMFEETVSQGSNRHIYDQGLSHRGIQRVIRNAVFLLEHRTKDITAPDGSTYPEADVIGSWRMAKSRTAIDLLVQREARQRELGVIYAQQRETPDLADVEKAIRGVYEQSILAVRKLWHQGGTHSRIRLIENRQALRYDLHIKPDHTFDVIYDERLTKVSGSTKFKRDPAYEKSVSGTWIWDGLVVFGPGFTLSDGLLVGHSIVLTKVR